MNNKKKEVAENAELIKSLSERFGKSLEEFRAQFAPRKLNVIEVGDKLAILAPITAKTIANYSVALVDPDKGMDVASRFLLEELWLDGDDELRDDEEYFIGAMMQLQNVVQTLNSSFTKL